MPRPCYLTPSTFPALMTNERGGKNPGKTAMKVVYRLALDMLGVEPPEEITSAALDWGKTYEWAGLQAYEDRHMVKVIKPGFQVCKDIPYVGGTADALVGMDVGVEMKCPFNSINHILREEQNGKYEDQYYGYMLVYDRPIWDFCSYDPRWPEELQLLEERIYRDENRIKEIINRCTWAHETASEIVHQTMKKAA